MNGAGIICDTMRVALPYNEDRNLIMKDIIGFTTTIPVETVFASPWKPCDLNNIFISDAHPVRFIERAERDGFPKSMCNWIKGIYGVIMENGIEQVITVVQGDCSDTHALSEILQYRGVRTIPFAYPFDRDRTVLAREIEKLEDLLGTDKERLAAVESEIELLRQRLCELDRLTWEERLVNGYENHLWLVQASDMTGDLRQYRSMVDDFIGSVGERNPVEGIRLGYIGVPPIIPDLYRFIEEVGGSVVFNEMQRQFAVPHFGMDIVERYAAYTYPYGIFVRLDDIRAEIGRRQVKGVIHYVQAFCFRAMEDVILKDVLGVPVLTIEGELPKAIDSRTKMRIEAFIEMLHGV